jgi:hypothetical protein
VGDEPTDVALQTLVDPFLERRQQLAALVLAQLADVVDTRGHRLVDDPSLARRSVVHGRLRGGAAIERTTLRCPGHRDVLRRVSPNLPAPGTLPNRPNGP